MDVDVDVFIFVAESVDVFYDQIEQFVVELGVVLHAVVHKVG
jgi:hypothetical protein